MTTTFLGSVKKRIMIIPFLVLKKIVIEHTLLLRTQYGKKRRRLPVRFGLAISSCTVHAKVWYIQLRFSQEPGKV